MASVRPGTKDDLPFVIDSWMSSFRSSSFAGDVDAKTYYKHQRQRVISALTAEGSKLLILHAEGSPETIIGWVCHNGPVLHYLYVKGSFRKMGLAEVLVNSAGLTQAAEYTHVTRDGARFAKAFKEWHYNPYLA